MFPIWPRSAIITWFIYSIVKYRQRDSKPIVIYTIKHVNFRKNKFMQLQFKYNCHTDTDFDRYHKVLVRNNPYRVCAEDENL